MKKRTLMCCFLVGMLVMTSCGGKKADTKATVEPGKKEESITTPEVTDTPEEVTPTNTVQNEGPVIVYNSEGVGMEDWITSGAYIEDKVYSDVPSFISKTEGDVMRYMNNDQAILTYGDEADKGKTHDELLDMVMTEKLNEHLRAEFRGGDVTTYSTETKEESTINDMPVTHYTGTLQCGDDVANTYSYEAYCFTYNDYPCLMIGIAESFYEPGNVTCKESITKNLQFMINSVRGTEEK